MKRKPKHMTPLAPSTLTPPAQFTPPQEKLDWLKSAFGKRMNVLIDMAIRLVDSGAPIDVKARRLIRIVDEVVQPVATVAACRRGCSHCCYQAVTINEWDAKRMARASGHTATDPRGMDRLTDFKATREEQARYAGVPCPFLKDGECSVYEVRPLACRWHFNLGDDPEDCDIINNPGHTVPLFNCDPLTFSSAVMFINAGVKWADLREFFPEVDQGK